MNLINLDRMDTMFMNSGNSKISDPQRRLLNFSDKINLKINNILNIICEK